MKTPKDILFRRHAAAEAKLDSIRQSVLAAESMSRNPKQKFTFEQIKALPLTVALKLWSELILPARRIWAGFAAVWLTIFIFNAAQSSPSPGVLAQAQPASLETIISWSERQKILADLGGWTEPEASIRRKSTFQPKPRSEYFRRWSFV